MEQSKTRLTARQQFFVATMLFGMFFGAGNLIFPIYMGHLAGRNMWSAVAGFLVTGVGLPLFLLVLAILLITAMVSPVDTIHSVAPAAAYETSPFFTGFLDGYNTMDALASLAFGIVVINVIRELGVTKPGAVAANTVKSGVISCIFMGVIYLAVTIVGAQSSSLIAHCGNGGEGLAVIAEHYLGRAGLVVLALTVLLACLKTAVGLVTSCAETFVGLFPKGPGYRAWAVIFSVVSLLIANIGLDAIISWSLPVLMLLFPLAITLILLALFGRLYDYDPTVYRWVTGLTLAAALLDFMKALPEGLSSTAFVRTVVECAEHTLPLFSIGLGWACPAAVGAVIGLTMRAVKN